MGRGEIQNMGCGVSEWESLGESFLASQTIVIQEFIVSH